MDTRRNYAVDALRFIFSLEIIYFHILRDAIMSSVGDNAAYSVLAKLCKNGGIVECFFIISGYFLYLTYAKKNCSILKFSVSRVFRLAPVLWFYLIIYEVIGRGNYGVALIDSVFLGCVGFRGGNPEVVWFVSPLFWGSILYYALFKTLGKKKSCILIAVITYFGYLVNLTARDYGFGRETVYGVISLGLFRGLAGLGLGILIAVTLEELQRIEWKQPPVRFARLLKIARVAFATVIEAGCIIYLAAVVVLGFEIDNKFLTVIVFSALFISFIRLGGLISRLLNREIFSKLAKYTYSAYVVEYLAFITLRKTLWKTALINHAGLCIFVSVVLSFMAGVVVYYLVEKPCYNIYRRLTIKED
ncbi:MAG: acyltransferase [Oscillospiraceae bacterium]|nr:acyltransferase [Oscillospiraceae bacterium]